MTESPKAGKWFQVKETRCEGGLKRKKAHAQEDRGMREGNKPVMRINA